MFGEYIGAGSGTTKLLLHLNGNSTDSSGNGNNGTASNITYVNGKLGRGASFNGTSSRINYPKNSNTYLLNNWTMSALVKLNSPSGGKPIYSMGNCYFGLDEVYYYDGNGDRGIPLSITDTTSWYSIIWTKSSATGQCLYINGSLVGTENSTSNNSNSYSNVNLGRFDSPGNSWFNGIIDEFFLENRVWTASEIKKYYTNSLGRF